MLVQEQTKLQFGGVIFSKVTFEATNYYSNKAEISVWITPKVYYPSEASDLFQIVMNVKVASENVFKLELNAIGEFRLDKDVTDEERHNFINTNAPAIVFPYVRAFIANFTVSTGRMIPPIHLPPHFFTGELAVHT